MKCLICGTEVPAGGITCPKCGAQLSSVEATPNGSGAEMIGWNPDGTALYGDRKKLKGKYRATIKPIRTIYICEWILLGINLLAVPLSEYVFWMTMGYLNGNSNNYEKITSMSKLTENYLWVLYVVVIALMIVVTLTFNSMKYYEAGFRNAFYAGVIMVAIVFLKVFFDDIFGIKMLFFVLSTKVNCVFIFWFCGSFERLMMQAFPVIARKWCMFRITYISVFILAKVCGFGSLWEENTSLDLYRREMISDLRTSLILGQIESWVVLILLVLEVRMIRKTYKQCKSVAGGRQFIRETVTK
ncbi:MAG: zinc ribbon domain-containing protein [Lachnospiraceae bacterium]|nr:zinc ribbon domain-containing protein [Lachnospiraceae bacterium]